MEVETAQRDRGRTRPGCLQGTAAAGGNEARPGRVNGNGNG